MGMKELAIIIISLILGAILLLNMGPSFNKSGDAVKASVMTGEVSNIVASSRMWVASNSADGTYTGLTMEKLQQDYFKSFTLSADKLTMSSKVEGNYKLSIDASGLVIHLTELDPKIKPYLFVSLAKLGTITTSAAATNLIDLRPFD
jgi:hypothetical protein